MNMKLVNENGVMPFQMIWMDGMWWRIAYCLSPMRPSLEGWVQLVCGEREVRVRPHRIGMHWESK